ncbi:hypothetical protein [Desulfotomaculum nigrificans]|uniref:hypothetical protein n=1 Tax=Desulfotomaculum nigrificans TaxID=1565 RepID=UPI0001FAE3B1|nr:hypothetical protein [Desulfotomaculum nigrificans]
MGNIPPVLYFVLAFLEGISIFFFLFAFTKIIWTKKELLLFSVVYSVLTFVIRKLPISFGIHTLLLICLIAGFLSYYYNIKLSSTLFGMILVYTVIIITEFFIAFLFTRVLSLQFDVVLSNPLWWFLSGLPHVILVFFLGIIIKNVGR